jgi:exportin-2 (importin alpha re-exporter)
LGCFLVREDAWELQVTELFTGYVKQLISESSSASQNWKSKDAAMYLVTALAARGKTEAQGATSTNQLFNVGDFFQSQVDFFCK